MTDPAPRTPRSRVPAIGPVDLGEVAAAVPGLARLAATTWLNTAEWGAVTTWKVTRRLLEAGKDPEAAAELAHELGLAAGTVAELAKRVGAGVPLPEALVEVGRLLSPDGESEARPPQAAERVVDPEAEDLRTRGEALLASSRDVNNDQASHPAYERILGEIAPDEARILVLLHRAGPQPSVDVRTSGLSPRPVAQALTMIPARAGLRHLDRMAPYLNNLERLGLVEDSREALPDHARYQVLEAQPDVLAAMASVRLTKVVRRSIRLTPFGADFVAAALVDPDELPLP